jgi:hypothetical protein
MSNVTHSTFGNHSQPKKSSDLEQYPTPPITAERLLDVEDVPAVVLNPCGTDDDAITAVLRAHGHVVHTNDVAAGGVDFMTVTEPPDGVECVVMNAPFRKSADFVAHALDIGIAKVCILQRLCWLECGASLTKRKPETERRARAVSTWASGAHLGVQHQVAAHA